MARGDEGGCVFASGGSLDNGAVESRAPSTCEALRNSQAGRVGRTGG